MAVNRRKQVDDAVQKNIDMCKEFIGTIESRRGRIMKELFEIQKQDIEFERLLQMSLLKLMAVHEFTNAGVLDGNKPKRINFPLGDEKNQAYG